ncbi:TetR/AcrR family transcriptional regulator [Amycolatopsis samaneae]|uniref:TetR/AcrR family transcriptional regulator n=1 Tax=Amycolatopsis samaneae TaxID=664691 RepID=A0ABW5GVN2_9PSEU
MVVFAGQGDARRSMSLLWREGVSPQVKSGPKPALSVDEIVDAAIVIADADGMAALSMRAVGERLGRTAMALYTYVPSKAELLDLMVDRALAEVAREYDLGAGWRAAATAFAEDLWAFYLRHPWQLQISSARPVLGPGEFAVQETVLRILFATGLPPHRIRWVLGSLFSLVRGSAQIAVEARLAARESDVSEEEWWYTRSGMLTDLAPDLAERFPMVTKLGGMEPDPDDHTPYLEREARLTFEAGIQVLFDGVEAAITG